MAKRQKIFEIVAENRHLWDAIEELVKEDKKVPPADPRDAFGPQELWSNKFCNLSLDAGKAILDSWNFNEDFTNSISKTSAQDLISMILVVEKTSALPSKILDQLVERCVLRNNEIGFLQKLGGPDALIPLLELDRNGNVIHWGPNGGTVESPGCFILVDYERTAEKYLAVIHVLTGIKAPIADADHVDTSWTLQENQRQDKATLIRPDGQREIKLCKLPGFQKPGFRAGTTESLLPKLESNARVSRGGRKAGTGRPATPACKASRGSGSAASGESPGMSPLQSAAEEEEEEGSDDDQAPPGWGGPNAADPLGAPFASAPSPPVVPFASFADAPAAAPADDSTGGSVPLADSRWQQTRGGIPAATGPGAGIQAATGGGTSPATGAGAPLATGERAGTPAATDADTPAATDAGTPAATGEVAGTPAATDFGTLTAPGADDSTNSAMGDGNPPTATGAGDSTTSAMGDGNPPKAGGGTPTMANGTAPPATGAGASLTPVPAKPKGGHPPPPPAKDPGAAPPKGAGAPRPTLPVKEPGAPPPKDGGATRATLPAKEPGAPPPKDGGASSPKNGDAPPPKEGGAPPPKEGGAPPPKGGAPPTWVPGPRKRVRPAANTP